MANYKYYAVKKGKTPGIYMTWADCAAQVQGFTGAVYKGFQTAEEAAAFVDGKEICPSPESAEGKNKVKAKVKAFDEKDLPDIYAFTDGSFNQAEGRYGYGGFLIVNGDKHILQGDGTDQEMAAMRNVAGEISGATAAIEKALELGLKELTIFYDYEGVKHWAEGTWKRNKAGTIAYAEYVSKARESGIKLFFVHVKGHSGIPGNEEADRLAKEACGVV